VQGVLMEAAVGRGAEVRSALCRNELTSLRHGGAPPRHVSGVEAIT
jgi:hypothetical protein